MLTSLAVNELEVAPQASSELAASPTRCRVRVAPGTTKRPPAQASASAAQEELSKGLSHCPRHSAPHALLQVPRLVFISPHVEERKGGRLRRASAVAFGALRNLAKDKYRLVFLDPVTGTAAKTGEDGHRAVGGKGVKHVCLERRRACLGLASAPAGICTGNS